MVIVHQLKSKSSVVVHQLKRKSSEVVKIAILITQKMTFFWERFAMSCNRMDTDIFEYLEGYIDLYMWSKTDDLFENIMEDMVCIKNSGYSLEMLLTLQYASTKKILLMLLEIVVISIGSVMGFLAETFKMDVFGLLVKNVISRSAKG